MGYVFLFLLFIAGIVFAFYKPLLVGRLGESIVGRRLKDLDASKYKVLNDILIPSNGNTKNVQIDHLIISNFGLFCIETKMYKGWIFGNARQKFWTQVIYRRKERFYNPLYQNFAHTQAIKDLIGLSKIKAPIVSIVVFPQADKLQVSGSDMVINRDLLGKIYKFDREIYSDFEKDKIYQTILNSTITDKGVRNSHIEEVRRIINT